MNQVNQVVKTTIWPLESDDNCYQITFIISKKIQKTFENFMLIRSHNNYSVLNNYYNGNSYYNMINNNEFLKRNNLCLKRILLYILNPTRLFKMQV